MIKAVWLVRSHQIAAELRFWLTYIGYDRRDPSLAHKVYLGYATLFFSIWGFATLSLLASFAGGVLRGLGELLAPLGFSHPLAYAAAGAVGLLLLGWGLYRAYGAARTSPLTFSEDDAALICQAPVSRPAVALFWLLGEWIRLAPLFWAVSVTLAFALQDAELGPAVTVEYVPRYVAAGLRALVLVLPLQGSVMALGWAWGVLRLQRDRIRRHWWLGPAGLALATLALLTLSGGLLAGLFRGPGGLVFAPLTFPLAAAYGLEWPGWGLGLALALGWLALSAFLLGWVAAPLNLGRAAQETTGRSASEAAAQSGSARAAAEISLRRRLGAGHAPSRLPPRPGWGMLAWKAAVGWDRRGGLRSLGAIFVIFVAGLALALVPDWGARAWAALAWLAAVQQLTAGPLVDDLGLWPLFRGLPFSAKRSLLGDLALPWGLVLLLGLAAGAAAWLLPSLGFNLGTGPQAALGTGPQAALGTGPQAALGTGPQAAQSALYLVLLVPGAALSAGLAAAVDLLRSSRTSRLLAGQPPLPGTTGVVIGCLALGLVALAVGSLGGGLPGFVLGALVSAGAAWLLLEIAAGAMERIE